MSGERDRCTVRTADASRKAGLVRSWSADRPFGFIQVGKRAVFVHRADVEGCDVLRPGTPVTFEMGADERGRSKAVRVHRIPRVERAS